MIMQGRSVTILTSTHMGPYGFKNFPQNNVFAFLSYIILAVYRLVYNRGDVKTNKAFKTFFFELVQECLPAQGKAPLLYRNLEFKSVGWKNCGMCLSL